MNFLIISSVVHSKQKGRIFGYAPYVREINIWSKFVSKLTIVAPLSDSNPTKIDCAYEHQDIAFIAVKSFSIVDIIEIIKTISKLPKIIFVLYQSIKKADHLHLRCPSNIGLLACFVQISFPNKPKSAKYAGNWDFSTEKPFSYKLQQWILNNTFLTKNIKVLVYGEWENSSKNIVPFFTATYSEKEVINIVKSNLKEVVKFIFAGMLVKGKNPLYAIQLVEGLNKNGIKSSIELYGEGLERDSLQNYIHLNNLQKIAILKGNQSKETLQLAYQKSHFVLLPSISEGWPKAIAEGMFWGCVPLALQVSCVPQMLDFGNRGLLISLDLETDLKLICDLILNQNKYADLSEKSKNWSQEFTTEKFELAIKNIVLP